MKYINAIFSNYIFFILNTIFFLVITSISIRVMGEDFFGLWSIINAILLFSGVGTLGMGAIINKFGSEEGDLAAKAEEILTAGMIIIFPMAILTSGIILLLRGWISSMMNVTLEFQIQFSQALIFTSLSFFPQFLSKIPSGFLYSQLKNKLARLIDFITVFLLWVGVVALAKLTHNLVWMAAWGLVVHSLSLLALLVLAARMGVLRWRVNFVIIKRMLNFSSFSFLESLAVLLFQEFDRILVGIAIGPTAAGVYSVGTSVGGRLSIVTGQATDVMIPYASRKDSLNNHEELFNVLRHLSKAISFLLAILGGLLILWMDKILSIWISPGYAAKYTEIFRIIVLAYIALSLSRPSHQTLTGLGKVKFTSLTYLILSFVMLGSVYGLSKNYGLIGAAIANYCMVFLWIFNFYLYSVISKSISWFSVIKDSFWAIIIPLLFYFAAQWNLSVWVRIMASIGLVIFISILASQDELIRHQFSKLYKRAAGKLINYHS